MTATRRELRFETLDEAVHDAEALLRAGYDRAGNWTLAQCCHHLAVLMEWPIDGFPQLRFPLNFGCWVLKKTLARRQLRKILDRGSWPAGTPTDKRTVVASDAPDAHADAEGVTRLTDAVQLLLSHDGPWKESPLFGMLDKDELIRLHRIHTAHHLSFLVPEE